MSEQLRYLAEAYFHQDYDVEYSGPDAAVEAFRTDETPEFVDELVIEIDGILASSISETELKDLWNERYGASYEPTYRDGITYREWFAHVREILVRPQV